MTEFLAHSKKGDVPPQPYEKHVACVTGLAGKYAREAQQYGRADGDLLLNTTEAAATYHDLGKLDDANQTVLSNEKTAASLPINHTDAGTAFLLSDKNNALLSAVAIRSHHIGLPDFTAESTRAEGDVFRDDKTKEHVDSTLPILVNRHKQLINTEPQFISGVPSGDLSVFTRLVLSCLVDADHTDTAINYGNYPHKEPSIELRPSDRLSMLDQYVKALPHADDSRSRLRDEMYEACKASVISDGIASCDAPVGTGKTTAVMAHLLSAADKRNLRRIFVVLPFTNIIQQSVEVYRKALTLPGENPADVVAELHHRADFENEDARYLTALWRAPIIVTTAVAFFETLASNAPSTLRRLHELPGSAIFLDEAHAALPAKLLPIAWRWMNVFADEWSCYWVLASGSLNRFWEIKEISEKEREVPDIGEASLREKLKEFEQRRVQYKYDLKPKTAEEFIEWAASFPGPRLIVVNTVQTAAVLAARFREKFGQEHVEHLSTALTAKDRNVTIERVKQRLDDESDNDWTLVATSCVEAGIDLSFTTGFRELGALTSLLQTSGRVNRSGDLVNAEMWTFCLTEDAMLKTNPSIKNAASVLREILLSNNPIAPSMTTAAIEDEIKLYGTDSICQRLVDCETRREFPFVDKNFKVIESDTRIAIVDEAFAFRIRMGRIDWRELQKNSVQIAKYKLDQLHVPTIADGIYHWQFAYNSFLGYMAGIIELQRFEGGILII